MNGSGGEQKGRPASMLMMLKEKVVVMGESSSEGIK